MFFRKQNKNNIVDSFNKVIFTDLEGKNIKLEDTIVDDVNLENEYIEKEQRLILKELLNNLPNEERKIIKIYMGFYDGKRYTGKEIGEKYNLSQSYISRKIKKF